MTYLDLRVFLTFHTYSLTALEPKLAEVAWRTRKSWSSGAEDRWIFLGAHRGLRSFIMAHREKSPLFSFVLPTVVHVSIKKSEYIFLVFFNLCGLPFASFPEKKNFCIHFLSTSIKWLYHLDQSQLINGNECGIWHVYIETKYNETSIIFLCGLFDADRHFIFCTSILSRFRIAFANMYVRKSGISCILQINL